MVLVALAVVLVVLSILLVVAVTVVKFNYLPAF